MKSTRIKNLTTRSALHASRKATIQQAQLNRTSSRDLSQRHNGIVFTKSWLQNSSKLPSRGLTLIWQEKSSRNFLLQWLNLVMNGKLLQKGWVSRVKERRFWSFSRWLLATVTDCITNILLMSPIDRQLKGIKIIQRIFKMSLHTIKQIFCSFNVIFFSNLQLRPRFQRLILIQVKKFSRKSALQRKKGNWDTSYSCKICSWSKRSLRS